MALKSLTKSVREHILDVVHEVPGLTRKEIAQAIYGPDGYPGLVAGDLVLMKGKGEIIERPKGSRGAFTYDPV